MKIVSCMSDLLIPKGTWEYPGELHDRCGMDLVQHPDMPVKSSIFDCLEKQHNSFLHRYELSESICLEILRQNIRIEKNGFSIFH